MEAQTTTPVGVLQELIAIHTTRKEAVEKLTEGLSEDDTALEITSAARQSDQFITELMNELSTFGDAVQADADRDNKYQALWKKNSAKVAAMNADDKRKLFQSLEESLKDIYTTYLETRGGLPESMLEILAKQSEELNG